MNLTEGEVRALLASAVLVALAAVGRTLLEPGPGEVSTVGLRAAGDVDSALAVAESLYAERSRRATALAPGERLDPNGADARELDRLPGVGPALARAIVEDRRRNGPFRSLADLERVPGLGSTTLRRLEPHLTLPPDAAAAGTTTGGASAAAAPPGATWAGEASSSAASGPQRLDVNRASAVELQALPGIGPARAAAIVRWREEHGRFRRLEDLLEVPGIGPATLERLSSLVAVGP